MYVELLKLRNFRGFFGEQNIWTHPRLTVLVGLNGAGKSAVLDALGWCLLDVSCALGGLPIPIRDHAPDLRGTTTGGFHATLRLGDGDSLGVGRAVHLVKRDLGRLRTPDAVRKAFEAKPDLRPHLGHIHSSSTRAPRRDSRDGSFEGRWEAYEGAFDSESVQFDALETWFEREESLENQRKVERLNLKYELRSLSAVRRAVQCFLELLHSSSLGSLRVVRFHDQGKLAPARGQLVIRKGDDELFLRQLSDGERRLVLLVADTARRMVILNPGLEDALLSPGVLLIDEIELHLHPQWQRRVIPALQAAFPQLQLIVSTHAPAVLATVPNECVVVLDGGKVLEGTPRVFGLDSNSILNGLMATPTLPDAIQARFDALYALIDDDPAAAPAAIDALAADVGADHPELVRARGLLVFLAG